MPHVYHCPGCTPLAECRGLQDPCERHRPENWRLWDRVLTICDRDALEALAAYDLARRRDVPAPRVVIRGRVVAEYDAIKALEINFEHRLKEEKARADAAAGVYANPLPLSYMETRFPAWKAGFFAYLGAWLEAGGDLARIREPPGFA